MHWVISPPKKTEGILNILKQQFWSVQTFFKLESNIRINEWDFEIHIHQFIVLLNNQNHEISSSFTGKNYNNFRPSHAMHGAMQLGVDTARGAYRIMIEAPTLEPRIVGQNLIPIWVNQNSSNLVSLMLGIWIFLIQSGLCKYPNLWWKGHRLHNISPACFWYDFLKIGLIDVKWKILTLSPLPSNAI